MGYRSGSVAPLFKTFAGPALGGLGNLKPFSPLLRLTVLSTITSQVCLLDSWLFSMVCTAQQSHRISPAGASCAACLGSATKKLPKWSICIEVAPLCAQSHEPTEPTAR